MDVEIVDSPVWDEYLRQTAGNPDGPVDLTPLWRAAGRPRNKSPRYRYRNTDEILSDDGGRDGGRVTASVDTALCYAQVLDFKIMVACGEVFFRKLHADPARHMAGCPDPIMALFAVPAVMRSEGVSAEEAGRQLVAEVTARSSCEDPYAQETLVAKVRRAVRGEPNCHVRELWEGPIARSFDKPSGRRWVADLVEQLVPADTEDGPRHKVYPARDERVMLVVRKIIRGLCHKEKVATAVEDRRVRADVMVYSIPEEFRREMTWRQLGVEFLRYGFDVLDDLEHDIQSVWSLTFFERREFFGTVSITDS